MRRLVGRRRVSRPPERRDPVGDPLGRLEEQARRSPGSSSSRASGNDAASSCDSDRGITVASADGERGPGSDRGQLGVTSVSRACDRRVGDRRASGAEPWPSGARARVVGQPSRAWAADSTNVSQSRSIRLSSACVPGPLIGPQPRSGPPNRTRPADGSGVGPPTRPLAAPSGRSPARPGSTRRVQHRIKVAEERLQREGVDVALHWPLPRPSYWTSLVPAPRRSKARRRTGICHSAAVLLNGTPGMSTTTGLAQPPRHRVPDRPRSRTSWPGAGPAARASLSARGGIAGGRPASPPRRPVRRPPRGPRSPRRFRLGPVLAELPLAVDAVDEDLDPDDRPKLSLDVVAARRRPTRAAAAASCGSVRRRTFARARRRRRGPRACRVRGDVVPGGHDPAVLALGRIPARGDVGVRPTHDHHRSPVAGSATARCCAPRARPARPRPEPRPCAGLVQQHRQEGRQEAASVDVMRSAAPRFAARGGRHRRPAGSGRAHTSGRLSHAD